MRTYLALTALAAAVALSGASPPSRTVHDTSTVESLAIDNASPAAVPASAVEFASVDQANRFEEGNPLTRSVAVTFPATSALTDTISTPLGGAVGSTPTCTNAAESPNHPCESADGTCACHEHPVRLMPPREQLLASSRHQRPNVTKTARTQRALGSRFSAVLTC